MKKIISIVILIMLLLPLISFAHPGNTDSSGRHTCRTNCPSWGLSYGQYHGHGSSGGIGIFLIIGGIGVTIYILYKIGKRR